MTERTRAMRISIAMSPMRGSGAGFFVFKDLADKYEPDLLYTEGAILFEEYGQNVVCET